MGSGYYTSTAFCNYSTSRGCSYDVTTDRISGHEFTETRLNENLNPHNKIRECCNSEEHPNTIPVILGLDVTGSMGNACAETAAALSQIVKELYNKYKDIEIMTMGIGDFECDNYPLQCTQFESDVRIAEQMDQIYMEHGGGGNGWESYTAAWWYGLYRTKLDCFNDQGRKGIIITMGDEPLNPDLWKNKILNYLGKADSKNQEYLFKTEDLYKEASKKFDIFHIAVDDPGDCYQNYKKIVDRSFKAVIGENFKISTINKLKDTICQCISLSISNRPVVISETDNGLKHDENGGIIW